MHSRTSLLILAGAVNPGTSRGDKTLNLHRIILSIVEGEDPGFVKSKTSSPRDG